MCVFLYFCFSILEYCAVCLKNKNLFGRMQEERLKKYIVQTHLQIRYLQLLIAYMKRLCSTNIIHTNGMQIHITFKRLYKASGQ